MALRRAELALRRASPSWVVALLICATSVPRVAHADPVRVPTVGNPSPSSGTVKDDARAAYKRGAEHYDAGRYAEAAKELVRADTLVPSAVAIELAMNAAVRAADGPLAMMLAERAEGRGLASATIADVRARFATKTARIAFDCPHSKACRASVDGRDVSPSETTWVTVGTHRLTLDVDDTHEAREPNLGAGERLVVVVTSTRPPSEPRAPAPRASTDTGPSWSPIVFWGAASLTAVVGGVTAISGFDAVSKNDEFLRHPDPAVRDDGMSAQARTNVLLVGTLVCAAATVAIGLFATRWSSSSPSLAKNSGAVGVSW